MARLVLLTEVILVNCNSSILSCGGVFIASALQGIKEIIAECQKGTFSYYSDGFNLAFCL